MMMVSNRHTVYLARIELVKTCMQCPPLNTCQRRRPLFLSIIDITPTPSNRVDDTFSMVHTCAECGQKFLSRLEYNRHRSTHLQTHLDKWEEPVL
jgi:hypothetical protein